MSVLGTVVRISGLTPRRIGGFHPLLTGLPGSNHGIGVCQLLRLLRGHHGIMLTLHLRTLLFGRRNVQTVAQKEAKNEYQTN